MPVTATAAVGLAAALDATVGEPPRSLHPVTWFGDLVGWVDRDWPAPRLAGTVLAVVLPLGTACAAGLLVLAATAVDPWLGALAAGLVLFVTVSLRMLLAEAVAVTTAATTDLDTARDRLGGLAGRDAGDLSPGEVRSAAIESLAENLADGLVAPLSGFAVGALLGGLPLAAAAAAWIKGVNTLDSMLGYRGKPHGWVSARLDDLVMLVPARTSALVLALAGLAPGSLAAAREWARVPASPNSGWPMATAASVLGTELRKPDAYALNPGTGLPTPSDADRARRLVRRAGALSFLLAGVAAWF